MCSLDHNLHFVDSVTSFQIQKNRIVLESIRNRKQASEELCILDEFRFSMNILICKVDERSKQDKKMALIGADNYIKDI
jgi:hypothetical protein